MGLDMYLTKELYIYNHKRGKGKIPLSYITKGPIIKDVFNKETSLDGFDELEINLEKLNSLEFEVAYWRKANQIHKWFVDNVQDSVDDCREYIVEEDDLRTLVDLCKQVLADHSKAEELLPNQSGFFFGSTDYDEWYFKQLEQTVEMLEEALNSPDFNKYYYKYTSSW